MVLDQVDVAATSDGVVMLSRVPPIGLDRILGLGGIHLLEREGRVRCSEKSGMCSYCDSI